MPAVTNKIIPSGFPLQPGNLDGDSTRENVVDSVTTTGDDNDTIDKTDTGVSNKMEGYVDIASECLAHNQGWSPWWTAYWTGTVTRRSLRAMTQDLSVSYPSPAPPK